MSVVIDLLCKSCVFWILGNCDGSSDVCDKLETYEDWSNLDICVSSNLSVSDNSKPFSPAVSYE